MARPIVAPVKQGQHALAGTQFAGAKCIASEKPIHAGAIRVGIVR